MIADVVNRILPNKTRDEIVESLGPSPTVAEARTAGPVVFLDEPGFGESSERSRQSDLQAMADYYHDDLNHDRNLAYRIGRPSRRPTQIIPEASSNTGLEALLIRLGPDGRFQSWYIANEIPWRDIVGRQGALSSRPQR